MEFASSGNVRWDALSRVHIGVEHVRCEADAGRLLWVGVTEGYPAASQGKASEGRQPFDHLSKKFGMAGGAASAHRRLNMPPSQGESGGPEMEALQQKRLSAMGAPEHPSGGS